MDKIWNIASTNAAKDKVSLHGNFRPLMVCKCTAEDLI